AAMSTWAAAIKSLARDSNNRAQLEESSEISSDPFLMQAVHRLSGWLGDAGTQLSRREMFEYLSDVLRSESGPAKRDESGCVRVLSAENARNLSVPYVFVAGLAEKAFPLAGRDDCLLSEADVRRLAEQGLPLVSVADRGAYEMLLFYEIVTRATRRL